MATVHNTSAIVFVPDKTKTLDRELDEIFNVIRNILADDLKDENKSHGFTIRLDLNLSEENILEATQYIKSVNETMRIMDSLDEAAKDEGEEKE